MKHGFIGFGNLAKAIYKGLKNNKKNSFAYISKTNAHKEVESFQNLSKLIYFSEAIWLCIKPQNLEEILIEIQKNYLDLQNKVIISPIAGKEINFIEKYLGKNTNIIRIMPNLAIAYGKSITAYCTNKQPLQPVKLVINDLKQLGETVELSEKDFALFTALFGSGPAFILSILQIFKNKIIELKIPEKKANTLLVALINGTLTYFQENNRKQTIQNLIKNITSKGGTTEAGLNYFKQNKIDNLFENVIISAKKRADEL